MALAVLEFHQPNITGPGPECVGMPIADGYLIHAYV